jgi:uncharacterized protein YbjQ (UPF0145 family)
MTATPADPIPSGAVDVAAELRRGTEVLAGGGEAERERANTSDLTVDELLLLHAAGWEPVDLVTGVSVVSVPLGVWNWGQGVITSASDAHNMAFADAAQRLRDECLRVDGYGVVGVQVDTKVEPRHVDVELTGTAIRPLRGVSGSGSGLPADSFVSDLSARDFTLLQQAGWVPAGLAFGACFVYVPRRSVGTTISQSSQNVELVNFTQAMYAAREAAMERMQQTAIAAGGEGVVAVQVTEGPMSFARHAVGFQAWGTAVRLAADAHRFIAPEVVLPLDDSTVVFEAESLRGGAG